jgi:hypothetical protein
MAVASNAISSTNITNSNNNSNISSSNNNHQNIILSNEKKQNDQQQILNIMQSNCTPINKQLMYGALENFETEKQIGQGQFSQVFKARCILDGRTVALKRMKVK